MSTEQIVLAVVAALLVFWTLGAHNRLVELRNQIIAAWAQVDEPLQRRGAAAVPLLRELRAHFPDEQGALDAVQAALAQVQAGADGLRARPALAPRAAVLATAESALGSALSRLLALVEHRAGLAADVGVAPHVAALRDANQRLGFARQLFNDAVLRYNAAVRQFPTRLLARVFGFSAAGTL
ncbi:MAG: LemA family protein [Rubrivivax sp.]